MKKVILLIITFILTCPLVNLPVFIFNNLHFYDGNTFLQEIQYNFDYYYEGKQLYTQKLYYENYQEDVLKALLEIDFIPVDNTEAIILLAFRDIDAKSRMMCMPANNNFDLDVVLANIQFFELDGKNYVLCYYQINGFFYKLYTFENNSELTKSLDKECFDTDGIFKSAISLNIKPKIYFVIQKYIPVLLLSVILLGPYLILYNKNIPDTYKKTIKKLALLGIFVIPISAVLGSFYIHKYSNAPQDVSLFFYVLKEIFLRIIC